MSMGLLRRLRDTGAIPCRSVGRSVIIYFPNIERWAKCENGQDNPSSDYDGIRPIP